MSATNEKITHAWRAGMPPEAIAAAHGMSPIAVISRVKRLRRAGADLPARSNVVTWTPERVAYLRERWPHYRESLAELNMLPGQPVKSLVGVESQAKALGIERDPEKMFARRSEIARNALQIANANRVARLAETKYTPERDALLRERWHLPAWLLTLEYNALPGEQVTRKKIIDRGRSVLGLPHRDKPGSHRRKSPRLDRYSEARRACMRENWELPIGELTRRLNLLPGPELTERHVRQYGRTCIGLPARGPYRPSQVAVVVAKRPKLRVVSKPAPVWLPPVAPVPAAVSAPPPATPSVKTPLAGELSDGVVLATFREIRRWAGQYSRNYDGSNMHIVDKLRAQMGLPRVLQVEERAA